jgi:hypothetical protein
LFGRDLTGEKDLPVEQWLSQGERREIPWRVSLSSPELTFQLENQVEVIAEIDVGHLQKRGIEELRFLVKVAPKNAKWSDQGSYKGYSLGQVHPAGNAALLTIVFLQPGDYQVAVMAYDPASGKRSLTVRAIHVDGPHTAVYAALTSGLPAIRFAHQPSSAPAPQIVLPALAVRTKRAIQFDLILDLSTREEQQQVTAAFPVSNGNAPVTPPPWGSPAPAPDEIPLKRIVKRSGTTSQQVAEHVGLLGNARILAKLDFQPGCTRLTVFDVLRLQTLLAATPVNAVDWQQLGNGNNAAGKVVVDVNTLEGRKNAGKFLQQQIEQSAGQAPQCGVGPESPLHVIAVHSHGIHFPRGSEKPRIEPECNCKVFYFHKDDPGVSGGDDLKKMLEPLSPKVLKYDDPQSFRDRLLEFVEAVQQLP